MAYKAVTGTRTAEIELDGSVYTVNFGCSYNYYAVRNDSNETIYISTTDKSCTPGNDGVISIPSGGGYVHNNGFGGSAEVYISGSGSALVIAQDDGICPFFNPKRKGGEVTYQYMPVMTGITGFFEPSGIDIANGVWHNAVGENDIILTDSVAENDAVKFPHESFGTIPAPDEPEVIYIVFKKSDLGTDGECIIGKGMTSGQTGYAFDLFAKPQFSIYSAPYVEPNTNLLRYHVMVLSRFFDFNTAADNFAALYIDGDLVGSLNGAHNGHYNGNTYINRTVRNGNVQYNGISDLYVKMIAIGAEQSARDIIKNSEYLAKKFI